MARTNLPIIAAVGNGVVSNAAAAGTAIDAANGMNVLLPTTAIPTAPDADNLLLYVLNTTAGTKVVTVKAGANATYANVPAPEAGKGDLVTGALTGTTGAAWIGPFDSARFAQSDGSINIDFAAGMTGTICAVLVPSRF